MDTPALFGSTSGYYLLLLVTFTLSTEASKKRWLSTSAKRRRTVFPANGVRLKVMSFGARLLGSPSSVRKIFASMSLLLTEKGSALGLRRSTRYCWLGVAV